MPPSLTLAFVAAFGLCVGSFLNVCIYRLPQGRSLVREGSRCYACGIRLKWWQNIPVLSWVLQRGRCGCGLVPLSGRYPLVETLTAAWFAGVWYVHGHQPLVALIHLALGSALIVATFIDIDHFVIPDEISLGGCVAGLVLSTLVPGLHGQSNGLLGLRDAAIGLAVGGGGLFAIAWIGSAILRKEAMGMGDVKLLGALGAFLGWESTLFIIGLSSMFGASLGLSLILIRRHRWGAPMPFGPSLVAAAMVWILGGSRWLDAYLSLFRV